MMVGPYAWSFIATGPSLASCGDTICNNCSVSISSSSITRSSVLSSTSGDVAAIFILLQFQPAYHRLRPVRFLSKLRCDLVHRKFSRGVCKIQTFQCFICRVPYCYATGLRRRRGFCRSSLRLELEFIRWCIFNVFWRHGCVGTFGSVCRLQFLRQLGHHSLHR